MRASSRSLGSSISMDSISLSTIGMRLLEMLGLQSKTILNETQTLFQINLFIFLTIIAIGSVLSFISVFYLFSRIFTVGLAWFGKKIWKVKRNVISLSLKDYSSDFISFRRLVIVILIFSLCFIPGTIIHKDYQNHINLESNLALGCSDLRIDNWTNNQTIFNKSMTILQL